MHAYLCRISPIAIILEEQKKRVRRRIVKRIIRNPWTAIVGRSFFVNLLLQTEPSESRYPDLSLAGAALLHPTDHPRMTSREWLTGWYGKPGKKMEQPGQRRPA